MPETAPERTRRIVIADYDPAWPAVAARLGDAILDACGALMLAVEHIGSTAVLGLAAKPVIDLAPVVRGEGDCDGCVGPTVALGYEHRGEYGVPGRCYFRGHDPASGLDVHVHLFARDSVYLRRHLLFRDYLRAHPAEAEAYATVKRALAALPWRDGNEYADAKTPFVSACLERAEEWATVVGWTQRPG